MPKIHSLSIKNYKGIKKFEDTFYERDFICLIGEGDSGKSSILEAISFVLSPNWNLTFHDNDFYSGDTSNPIEIIVNITDLPEELIQETKFGLHLKSINKETKLINNEIDGDELLMTIKLTVASDLEPQWVIMDGKEEEITISANDRSRFNVFMVSDYIDRHFSWSKGNPLFTLLKSEPNFENENVILDSLRVAKKSIDTHPFEQFDSVTQKVQTHAKKLGVNIQDAKTSIDFRDLIMKESKVSLHGTNIPYRLKGKGTKRIISIAIQIALAESGGIILIDEIEQGLEPHRSQYIVSALKSLVKGQVFITTHSRDVIVELESQNLFKMKKGSISLTKFTEDKQGLIRAHPEGLLSRKIIVCEGPTEIGFFRAISKQMVLDGKDHPVLKGVRYINGGGNNMFEYAMGFKHYNFDVCLFCDSDEANVENKKDELKLKEVPIFDWDLGNNIESITIKEIPWNGVKEIINLASYFLSIKNGRSQDDEKKAIWESVCSNIVGTKPKSLDDSEDIKEIRVAIGVSANKNKWFKEISKGEALGDIVFKHFNEISEDSNLKRVINSISSWVED